MKAQIIKTIELLEVNNSKLAVTTIERNNALTLEEWGYYIRDEARRLYFTEHGEYRDRINAIK